MVLYFLYTSIRKARAGLERNNHSLHNLREYSNPSHVNIPVTKNDSESDLRPLIEIPETMEERMDEKFKNFKYCSDGPNEESLLGEGRYGAVHKVQERCYAEVQSGKSRYIYRVRKIVIWNNFSRTCK